MTENENKNSEHSEGTEKPEKKSRRGRTVRKTQSQALQEALGIQPDDLKDIEGKLAVIKFLDYISEEPLDFAFKERSIEQYTKKVTERVNNFDTTKEEDKLLIKGFEEKKILEVVDRIKTQTEEVAISKGINKSVEKKLRNLNLIIMAPLLAVAVVFFILPLFNIPVESYLMLIILCVFCVVPQFVRNSVIKKWFSFKEENRNEIYTKNRDDILVLKSYISEILSNVRSNLIELEVPLDLIKFSLFQRDYEDLNVINQKQMRGLTEYYVSFKYPEGMEPFPIPAQLQQQYNQPLFPEKKRDEKPEKNFVVLTEMKGKNGVITSFLPSLKEEYADKINQVLTDSDFSESELGFSNIIPNYSAELGIYCICGEVAKIETVNICNWKNEFKFYLFEGSQCKCGEQIYALSLMDEDDEIPEELKDIFSS
jgi:hypothetical protein